MLKSWFLVPAESAVQETVMNWVSKHATRLSDSEETLNRALGKSALAGAG